MPADAPRPRIASLTPPTGGSRLITPLAEARPHTPAASAPSKRAITTRPRQRAPWDDRTTAVARMPEPPMPARKSRPLPSPDESPLGFALERVDWDDDEEEEVTQATDPLSGPRKDDSGPRPKLDAEAVARALARAAQQDDEAPTSPDSRAPARRLDSVPLTRPTGNARPAPTSAPAPTVSPRPAPGARGIITTLPSRNTASAVTVAGHASPLDRWAPRVDSGPRMPMRLEPPRVVTPVARPVAVRTFETVVVGTPVPPEPDAAEEDTRATLEIPRVSGPAAPCDAPQASYTAEPAVAPASAPHVPVASDPDPIFAPIAHHDAAAPATGPMMPAHDPSIPPPTVDWNAIDSRVRDEVRAAVTNLGAPPRYASSSSSSTVLVVAVVCSLVGGVIGSGATLLLASGSSAAPAPTPTRATQTPRAPSTDVVRDALALAPPSSVAPPATEPSPVSAAIAAPAEDARAPAPTPAAAPSRADADADATTATPERSGLHLTPRQLAIRRRMSELRRRRVALARTAARAAATTAAASSDAPAPSAAPAPPAAPAAAPALSAP